MVFIANQVDPDVTVKTWKVTLASPGRTLVVETNAMHPTVVQLPLDARNTTEDAPVSFVVFISTVRVAVFETNELVSK